ncbi:hypothetical protein BDV18DRAFT_128582 [Aspergillus unguis]
MPVSRIPSIPYSSADPHSRIKRWLSTLPTFRPRYIGGSKNLASNPGSTVPSFQQSLPRKDRVPSLSGLRHGSRLHVRSGPITPPTACRSLQPPSIAEERRAARQTQIRPWDTIRSKAIPFSLSTRKSSTPAPESTIPSPETPAVSATHSVKAPRKTVRFACRATVIPVTPWIDREQHVYDHLLEKLANLRRKILSPHALKTAPKVDRSGYSLSKLPPASRKPVKSVRFGETTEVSVTRWIIPQQHTHSDPVVAKGGKLQGWSVTPLKRPTKEGDTEHYAVYCGSSKYRMLHRHCSEKSCDNSCSYGYLAQVQACRPKWTPEQVFKAWCRKREESRKQGTFRL